MDQGDILELHTLKSSMHRILEGIQGISLSGIGMATKLKISEGNPQIMVY